LVVVIIIGSALAYKSSQEEQAKREALHQAELREKEAQLARLKSDFEDAQKKESTLQASLASAKDDAEKARLKAELEKAQEQTRRAGAAVRGGGGGPKPGGGSKPCNCPPGDPLCSCL
jgi:colicin import membrane protein